MNLKKYLKHQSTLKGKRKKESKKREKWHSNYDNVSLWCIANKGTEPLAKYSDILLIGLWTRREKGIFEGTLFDTFFTQLRINFNVSWFFCTVS